MKSATKTPREHSLKGRIGGGKGDGQSRSKKLKNNAIKSNETEKSMQ